MNGIIDLNEVSRKLKRVSDFRNEATVLRTQASESRVKASSLYEELSNLLKKNNKEYGEEIQKLVEKKEQEALLSLKQAMGNDVMASESERNAEREETDAITRILSYSYECSDNDEKKMWNELIVVLDSYRVRDKASQEREKTSLEREKASLERYKEVQDIRDCNKNGEELENHNKKHLRNKRTHYYGLLTLFTVVSVYIVANLLGCSFGIDISNTTTQVLLSIILLLLICLIIVLARKLLRINKALLKMEALIARLKLSTDRDLGKPYRLDRELDMIYRILES